MSRNKKTSESLFQFMNLLIALLLKNGQYRTSLHYKASLNSFKRYRDNKDIALKEIDAEVMRSYEAYLHHTAEVCKTPAPSISASSVPPTTKLWQRDWRHSSIPSRMSIPVLPKLAREPYLQKMSARSRVCNLSRISIPRKRWQEIHSWWVSICVVSLSSTWLISANLTSRTVIFIIQEERQDSVSPSDGRRRCRSCWKSIRRRPPPHLISFLSLLMMETKDRIKLLTKAGWGTPISQCGSAYLLPPQKVWSYDRHQGQAHPLCCPPFLGNDGKR